MCNKEGSGIVKNVSVFSCQEISASKTAFSAFSSDAFFSNLIANKGERETRVIDCWRNARDHGKQKEEARRLARVLLPTFLCAEIYIKKDNSGKEAAGDQAGVQIL